MKNRYLNPEHNGAPEMREDDMKRVKRSVYRSHYSSIELLKEYEGKTKMDQEEIDCIDLLMKNRYYCFVDLKKKKVFYDSNAPQKVQEAILVLYNKYEWYILD